MKRFIIFAMLLSLYLGTHNGYLALWDTGIEKPVKVFPYSSAVYPKIDQQALKSGIPINSPADMKDLLQDFLS
ncbi:MAG: hypothetical protein IJO45_03525 [Oscillospiraceae bacterium]|nr:hypothetical protein [Oscillospiraceae bacterium]